MSNCGTRIIQVTGGGVDGVINGGSYNPTTQELTLTTSLGGSIVITGFALDTSVYGIDGQLSGARTVDMNGNDITWQNGGDFIIDGKLTVTGLIDPTGMQFSGPQDDAGMPNETIYITDGSASGHTSGTFVFKDAAGGYKPLHADGNVYSVTAADVGNAAPESTAVGSDPLTGDLFYVDGSGNWAAIPAASSANDRIFADNLTVNPTVALNPTETEISTFLGANVDTIVYYTGTDTASDPATHVYHVDNSGNVTTLLNPSSSASGNTTFADVADNTARDAIVGAVDGDTVRTLDTNTLWRYDGAAWQTWYVSPTGYFNDRGNQSADFTAINDSAYVGAIYTYTGAGGHTVTLQHNAGYSANETPMHVIHNESSNDSELTVAADAGDVYSGPLSIPANGSLIVTHDPANANGMIGRVVGGTATATVLPFGRMELTAQDAMNLSGLTAAAVQAGYTMTLPAAATAPCNIVPFIGVQNRGGLIVEDATAATFPDAFAVNAGGTTESSMVVPEDGEYRLTYMMPNIEDATFNEGQAHPVVMVDGIPVKVHVQVNDNIGMETILNLTAGQRVQMGYLSANVDAADNVDLAFGIDLDDANLSVSLSDIVIGYVQLEKVQTEIFVDPALVVPEAISHATFGLTADGSGIICPFDEGQGDTSVITNAAGTITLPAGKYKITSQCSRQGASLDYELYDNTNSVVLEKYSSDNSGFIGSLKPYYLTIASPIEIQIREGNNDLSVVWNGRQAGFTAFADANKPWSCFIDIQQLPTNTVVRAEDATVVEWTDFPMTIGGTTTAPTKGTTTVDRAQYKVVGKTLHVRYDFEQSGAGTAGSGNYLFPLPAGFTPDLPAPAGNLEQFQVVGVAGASDGVTFSYGIARWRSSVNAIDLATGNPNTFSGIGSAWYSMNDASVSFSFQAQIPLV